jgi:protein transport protein SEC23
VNKILAARYYVNINNNRDRLKKAVSSLQHDKHLVPRDQREKRATGCAVQVAIGLLSELGINTRFSLLVGGPCTVGHGKVVDLPLKRTIRSYVDIIEGNENTEYIKAATAYYDGLAETLVKQRHTFDIWSYGLDQFGLMEMKGLVNGTGGMLAMHELFDHFIFKTSFEKFYEANEYELFNFPVSCHLALRVSKELRVNGILGPARSLKDNALKQAAEMEIGEGSTSSWYLGGISVNSALCIILSHADSSAS